MKFYFLSSRTLLGGLIVLLSACQESQHAAPSNPTSSTLGSPAAVNTTSAVAPSSTVAPSQARALPAISVSTVAAVQRDMPIVLRSTGVVTPLSSVEIKPQVHGIVTKIHVKEGQFVQAGDVLFSLDSRMDLVNLAKAKAQLSKNDALLQDAKRQLARHQELMTKGFISQGALDAMQTNLEGLMAAVAADKAAVDAAQIALSYNRLTAPQSGRAGFITIATGSAVQANQTVLMTITQLDPIAVMFSLPQVNLSDAVDALKGEGTVVQAKLPGGTQVLSGRLKTVDNAVDAASGTIKMKAVFANKMQHLWPGGFAEVTLTARTLKNAWVIPHSAVVQTPKGAVIYVAENNKAVMRPIHILFADRGEAAVTGINAGDLVIVEGKQNLKPNVAVVDRTKAGKTP